MKKEPDMNSFEHIAWLNNLTPEEYKEHCSILRSKMDNNGWTHTDVKKPFIGEPVFVCRPKKGEGFFFHKIVWANGDEKEYPFWMECKEPRRIDNE